MISAEEPRQNRWRGRGRPRGPKPHCEADPLQVETNFPNRKVVRIRQVQPGGRVTETIPLDDGDGQAAVQRGTDQAAPSFFFYQAATEPCPRDDWDQWEGTANQGGLACCRPLCAPAAGA